MDPSYAAEYAERYPNGPCAHIATPEAMPRTAREAPPRVPRAGREGTPHGKAWRAIEESGQTHCSYCRIKFSENCRPTFDHKVPRAVGGTISDGFVMACQTCNSARGDVPYDEYMKAVREEWRLAKKERRGYRRPKRVDLPDGSKVILALSKKERKQAAAERV